MPLFNIIKLQEVSSTNDYLAKIINSNTPNGTVVITNKQTKGKGQLTNKWESEPYKNLTFSLLLEPNIYIEKAFWISKTISIGIVNALNKLGKDFFIKWPNDIYFKNKKIAGILIENRIKSNQITHAIIGIGVNINQDVFLSNAPNPISLKQIFKKTFDLENELKNILNSIFEWYNILKSNNLELIDKTYHKYLYKKDTLQKFSTNKSTITAKIQHVEEDGKLILISENGEKEGFYLHDIKIVL